MLSNNRLSMGVWIVFVNVKHIYKYVHKRHKCATYQYVCAPKGFRLRWMDRGRMSAMICMYISTICLWLMCYTYVDIVSIYMYIHIYVLLLGKNRVSRKVRDREKLSSTNVEKNSFYKCRIFSSTFVEFYKRRVLHL